MPRYNIGTEVIYLNRPELGKGKVIHNSDHYLIEFYEYAPDLHNGNDRRDIIGKQGHCWFCPEHALLSSAEYLEQELDKTIS